MDEVSNMVMNITRFSPVSAVVNNGRCDRMKEYLLRCFSPHYIRLTIRSRKQIIDDTSSISTYYLSSYVSLIMKAPVPSTMPDEWNE
jgi:hypothetical protein